jgi:hypothetical protein
MLEHRDQSRGDELFFFLVAGFKDIQADRIFRIRGIEIDDFVRPATGNEI